MAHKNSFSSSTSSSVSSSKAIMCIAYWLLIVIIPITNTQSNCFSQQLFSTQTFTCPGTPLHYATADLTNPNAYQFSIGFWIKPLSFCTTTDQFFELTITPSSTTITLLSVSYGSTSSQVIFTTTQSSLTTTSLTQATPMSANYWYYLFSSMDLQAGTFYTSAYDFQADNDHSSFSSSPLAYATSWTIGMTMSMTIGYNVNALMNEMIVLYGVLSTARDMRHGLMPVMNAMYMFSENIGFVVSDSSSMGNHAYFGASSSTLLDIDSTLNWVGTYGLQFGTGREMLTLQNTLKLNNDATSWQSSWTISMWIKKIGSLPMSTLISKKRKNGITNVFSFYLDTSNYIHLYAGTIDLLLGTSYRLQSNVYKLLTITLYYQNQVSKFYTSVYENNLYKLSNSLTLSTPLDEQLDDVLRIGDQSASFQGFFKYFRLFLGTTFISTSPCISGCSLSIGLINPVCLEYSTTPSCPTGQYIDNVVNDCMKCQTICSQCTDSSTCQSCSSPYGFTETSPTTCQCPTNLYENTTMGTCNACAMYTTNPAVCETCIPGYYVASSGDCQPCDSTCLSCNGSNSNNCLTCLLPSVLFKTSSTCEIPLDLRTSPVLLNAKSITYTIDRLHDPTQLKLTFSKQTPMLMAQLNTWLKITLKGISSSAYTYNLINSSDSSYILVQLNYTIQYIPLFTNAIFQFSTVNFTDSSNYTITPNQTTIEIYEYYALDNNFKQSIMLLTSVITNLQYALYLMLLIEIFVNSDTSNTFFTLFTIDNINILKYLPLRYPPNYDLFFDNIQPFTKTLDSISMCISQIINQQRNTQLASPNKFVFYNISAYLIDNYSAQLAILFSACFLCIILYLIVSLKSILRKHKRLLAVVKYVDHVVRWNFLVNFLMVNYVMFCIYLAIQLQNLQFNSIYPYDTTNSILSLILAPFVLIFIFMAYIQNFNHKLLDPKTSEQYKDENQVIHEDEHGSQEEATYDKLLASVGKYGVIHKDFKHEKVIQQMAMTIFLIRALIIIMIIYTMSSSPMMQVYFIGILNLAMIGYLVYFKPFHSKPKFIKALLNEGLLFLTSIFMIAIATTFHVGSTNIIAKIVFGWFVIILYIMAILISMVYTLMYELLFPLKNFIKERRMQKIKVKPDSTIKFNGSSYGNEMESNSEDILSKDSLQKPRPEKHGDFDILNNEHIIDNENISEGYSPMKHHYQYQSQSQSQQKQQKQVQEDEFQTPKNKSSRFLLNSQIDITLPSIGSKNQLANIDLSIQEI